MILSVRDLRVQFEASASSLIAVDGLSFDVDAGEIFVIIGESGSGKSLTAMSIVGLQPANARASGSVSFEGRGLLDRSDVELRRVRGREIGMIYQDPLGSLNPVWTVGNQIVEALSVHGIARGADARRRTLELLERVRIPDPARTANAYPHEISGGMRQRAMIAMALACRPKLLIADEPTTALDVTIKAQMLELLKDLRRDLGLTIILITHDMGVVAEIADRILVMYAGRIAEMGKADDIVRQPSHPYTKALMLSAMISATPPKQTLNAISGGVPVLGAFPAGCRFSPRCPRATDECRAVEPILHTFGPVQVACHYPIPAAADSVDLAPRGVRT